MITNNANFLNRFDLLSIFKKKMERAQLLFSQIQLQFTYFIF